MVLKNNIITYISLLLISEETITKLNDQISFLSFFFIKESIIEFLTASPSSEQLKNIKFFGALK